MHIFEKFKKEALTTPHEVQNPKGLRIWTNQKKNATAFKKVGQKKVNKQQAVKVKVSKNWKDWKSFKLEKF